MQKLAIKIDELLSAIPAVIKNRSVEYQPNLVRHRDNLWLYRVGDYVVRIKVPKIHLRVLKQLSKKNQQHLTKLKNRDILVSCTCDFWKYNGPDYHAHENNYSERTFSDLSQPVVRDPQDKFLLCKHAYSALKQLKADFPII
ncbi:MAG: hypothetical protein Q7R33_05160 [Nitrosarchaeum sp.]|nr:hypothetical protein [Nitrosarchaeum sp.]